MKTNRRKFLKVAGAAGGGIITGAIHACGREKETMPFAETLEAVSRPHRQHFNMCRYAASKLEKVRLGIVGIGSRGTGAVHRLKLIEGLEIKAVCDKKMDRAEKAQKVLVDFGLPPAEIYGGSEDKWKEMFIRDDLDLIYIVTPWSLHTPMCVFAMENGKHAAVEVPAAVTIDECWKLVETSEKTKKHCMMLENCCYDFFELLTLNMARQGFFGDIIHGEGGYIHHTPPPQGPYQKPANHDDDWRRIETKGRRGNTYPTHGLGPVAQAMNINRGDIFDYMTCMASDDFILAKRYAEYAKVDDFYKQFDPKSINGNINTSTIRTVNGKTIMLQYETAPPRVYSRIHTLSGTKGAAQKYPLPGKISTGIQWFTDEQMAEITESYTPEIVKRVGEMAMQVGGHGGMDFIMDWRLIDCLRNGLPLDQDVYDAAAWSAIGPLSDWSVANRSNSIKIPDFTCGSYKNNIPVNISLDGGGNTGVRTIGSDVKSKQMNV
jgi:hypothetical protein